MTNEELIAELREVAKGSIQGTQVIGSPIMRGGELAARAADALAALTTPQEPKWEHGVVGGEDLLHRLMDTLAYYHCRSVNPKADSPYLGYHAMSEGQREFLRERQREAAEEVLRMWQAEPGLVAPAPVESDVRERLYKLLFEGLHVSKHGADEMADAILAAFPVLSLAAVPDAATELRAERDAALEAIERVREVAMQDRSVEQHNEMVPATDIVDLIREQSSADYLAALDGAPEPEWKVQYGRRNRETGTLHWLTEDPRDDWWHENQDRYEHVKRYTSPPLPVEGESRE